MIEGLMKQATGKIMVLSSLGNTLLTLWMQSVLHSYSYKPNFCVWRTVFETNQDWNYVL